MNLELETLNRPRRSRWWSLSVASLASLIVTADTGQLILFRSFQAAGSALIMANHFALVTALFPREERGRAMGIAGGAAMSLWPVLESSLRVRTTGL